MIRNPNSPKQLKMKPFIFLLLLCLLPLFFAYEYEDEDLLDSYSTATLLYDEEELDDYIAQALLLRSISRKLRRAARRASSSLEKVTKEVTSSAAKAVESGVNDIVKDLKIEDLTVDPPIPQLAETAVDVILHTTPLGPRNLETLFTKPKECKIKNSTYSGPCNGDVALCKKRFNEVALAGTHNSFATTGKYFVANQELTISEQIKKGVRAFMLDVYKIPISMEAKKLVDAIAHNKPTYEYMVCHAGGKSDQCYILGMERLSDILAEIRDGINKYRGDVFVIILESYVAAKKVEKAFKKACLDQVALSYTPGSEWPTLEEMISTNKRLVVLSNDVEGRKTDWYLDKNAVAKENPFEMRKPSDHSCEIDRGKQCRKNCLYIQNMFLTPKDSLSSPDLGKKMNSLPGIRNRVMECVETWGQIPNVIAVDWVNKGDLFEVVKELNNMTSDDVGTLSFEDGIHVLNIGGEYVPALKYRGSWVRL